MNHEHFTVLVDDIRNGIDYSLVIRDPRIAIEILRKVLKKIYLISWDNDMGFNWEYEGRNKTRRGTTP
jgi:hypothetical protein